MLSQMVLAFLGILLAVPRQDTCIAFISQNLAKGNGNWFTYYQISDQHVKVREGDVFTYEVFLDPKNPVAKGGVDIDFDSGPALRDRHPADQNGIDAHGDGVLAPAIGKWYERKIPLDVAKGRTSHAFTLVFEGDTDGRYVQFVDNIFVRHKDGTKTSIYEDGAPPIRQLSGTDGYTQKPSCAPVERSKVFEGADLEPLIQQAERVSEKLTLLREAQNDIDVVAEFVKRNPDAHVEEHLKEAQELLASAEARQDISAEDLQAVLHAAKHALSHTHPAMTGYTGHLVGHAHIDLQWLWEWQEGIVFSRDTFAQACKFMDEFPGFCFSQSSSALYKATEEHFPDIFAKMKQKIAKGQWEIVGGRVCEGDTNMISAESHARHFLYGQRYFKEKFGKQAIVGWEPDTFGHTIQMPQILKLGGCNYYYFCRGGKGKPLFWWKGLDGTKILTFDEPASGSWYNADLSYAQFKEMLDFQSKTGSKDMLWVYGVGNHGGGPTREHIEEALRWMKSGYLPNAKFSTATQFFKKLETYDLTKIPVIDQELNPVFDGCYTSHSEIKQLNRNAEAETTSAEALAAVASLFGFQYPQAAFRRNWEEICFNHHHDTLPGSGIHAPYENTKIMLRRVIADDQDITNRALQLLSMRVTPKPEGISVLVFNPTGWARSGWIETLLVQSGWNSGESLNPEETVAEAPDGRTYPVVLLDPPSRRVKFWAQEIPAFGYRVFHLIKGVGHAAPVKTNATGYTIENDNLLVQFDPDRGSIIRLFDKSANRELVTANGRLGQLETHYEGPGGMSAWVIGPITKVENMACTGAIPIKGADYAGARFTYEILSANNPDKLTRVTQTFRLESNSRELTCDVDCDWQHIGNSQSSPTLRVAFETAFQNPTATYEVPFGSLERPIDGKEYPALKWADIADDKGGISILNDSKHGYSAKDSTLRLTLIRSNYSPDPVPNPGEHHWRYSIYTHTRGWREADTVRHGAEFNQPLLSMSVPFDAKGSNPLEWSPLSISDPSVIATCLKRAEDDSDLVLRVYQSTGADSVGTVRIAIPTKSAQWVNFLEGSLGKAPIANNEIALQLHPFEIRTVKVKH